LGKVINLNKYRKRRAKLEREKQADVNRRLHGRSAAERARDELSKRQLTRAVDGAKLEGHAEPDAGGEGREEPPKPGV
jgi:uncharacterized protein DUF4169